jgi:nucleotide-binding universal stress UspA family protein
MFTHILVPMDGSALAECVIPHVISIARAFDAKVTLLHVLEPPHETGSLQPVNPIKWHLRKNEAGIYLEQIGAQFQQIGIKVEKAIQEGPAATCIINHANNIRADFIILSTHGSSGLSMWNVSSVVQKIILSANKSTLLVRAQKTTLNNLQEIHYERLFVGLDCSARAELALPVANCLAERYKSILTIGTVVQKPQILNRLPVSDDDASIIARIAERNHKAAAHYLSQLQAQLSLTGVKITTKLIVSENQISALHNMVEEEKADMVMLVAHGHSGEERWPYGSVATSFIAYGTTSLLIVQDLSEKNLNTIKIETGTFDNLGH